MIPTLSHASGLHVPSRCCSFQRLQPKNSTAVRPCSYDAQGTPRGHAQITQHPTRAELRPTLNWHLFDWVQVKCNHGLLAYVLRAKSLAAARERYSLQRNPLRDFLYITNR